MNPEVVGMGREGGGRLRESRQEGMQTHTREPKFILQLSLVDYGSDAWSGVKDFAHVSCSLCPWAGLSNSFRPAQEWGKCRGHGGSEPSPPHCAHWLCFPPARAYAFSRRFSELLRSVLGFRVGPQHANVLLSWSCQSPEWRTALTQTTTHSG